MTLGTPGEQGDGPNNFTSPSDVAVAPKRRRVHSRRPQPRTETTEW